MPRALRPAFLALWNVDLALADVVATSSDPRLGAIRLAWWRERLDELDQGKMSAEPRLQAVTDELLRRGIRGRELSKLEDAWLPLLDPFPWDASQAEGLKQRGRLLFGIGARLLGSEPADAETVGAFWSLMDGAHHCSDPRSRDHLFGEAREALAGLDVQPAPRLRPLTVLAALAAADLVREGSGFARLSAAVRHRLTGHLPR